MSSQSDATATGWRDVGSKSGADPSMAELSESAMMSESGMLSGSGMVLSDPDESGAKPAPPEASLLLSADAINKLQETAALPIPMDDSALLLSDAAILKLGRAAAGVPEKKPESVGAHGISPSGILRMAAGLRLGDEVDPTRADSGIAEAVSKIAAKPSAAKAAEPARSAKAADSARPAKAAEPVRPAQRPVPMNISQMPTTLLSPIAGPPPDDRTSMDAAPFGSKKHAPDEMAETAIRPLPGPISVHNPGPLPAGAAPLMRRPTSTGMVIVPSGGFLGEDIELPPEPPPSASELKASERKAQIARKAESTVLLGEPSLGAQATNQGLPATGQPEATAIRPVFQRFGPADPREKGRPATAPEPTITPPRSGWFSKLLIGLLAVGAVGAAGWFGTNWYLRDQQTHQLASRARTSYDAAFEHGRLTDFITAEAQLRALGDVMATDDAVRQARALLLTATRFEFGGGPQLEGGAEWEQESLGAVRQIETEPGALAQAALIFSALAQADLPSAEKHLELLQGANTSEGRYRLPNGMVDYLASQVALLAGREEQAVLALQKAVQKQRLPLWQRRLGSLLLHSGRDEEALVILTAAQKRQEDLIGAQIDLAYARGRTDKRDKIPQAKTALQPFVEPPKSGVDPAGRAEHARAALQLADLTLRAEPSARAAARELLTKAQTLAPPTDVLFLEEVAQARLRIGDGEAAATVLREVVTRLPQRRTTRILLAQSLLTAKQGNDALSALGPLIETKEKPDKGDKTPIDAEAQLLRAQALLISHDTLAAQQVIRQVMAATPATNAQHIGAQLLTGELFLRLGEPVSAHRSLEPLMRLIEKTKPGAADDDKPTGGDKISAEQRLRVQLLWARTLLATRPPQQAEARTLLEAAVAQAPDNAEAHYLLGRLLRELGVLGPAEEQLTASVRVDDRLTSARRELAGLLMLRGEFGKAHELYSELLKDEKDSEILISAARAERLDGAPEKALATLLNVHRQTGEISGKYDEEFLGERARALLIVERGGEVVNLLTGPTNDLTQLKKPTLPALLIRAHVSLAEGPQQKPELALARALLTKLPKPLLTDFDVRLAEAELLIAEGKRLEGNQILTALVASLQTISPTSNGEDTALRQQAQRLLEGKKN